MDWIKVSDQLPEDGQIVEVKFQDFELKDITFKKTEKGYEFVKKSSNYRGLNLIFAAQFWRDQK